MSEKKINADRKIYVGALVPQSQYDALRQTLLLHPRPSPQKVHRVRH